MNEVNLEDLRNWREKTAQRTDLEIIFETFLFVVIESLAVGGNVMVITAVWKSKTLRSITHQYITVLSVADLLVALLSFPFFISGSITGQWPYGKLVCRIQGNSILIWCSFSMIIVSMTAVNRYFCVVKPTLYKTIFTSKSTVITIVTTLISCTLLLVGISSGFSATFQFGPHLFCIPIFPTREIQMAILLPTFFLFILVPMLTIFICYFKVFRRVRQHVNKIAPTLSRRPTQNLKARVEEVKITKVVLVVLIVFFLLWAPICIVGTLFSLGVFIPRWAHLMYDYLVTLSAATNPVVYGFFNQAFRAEYAKILGFRFLMRRRISVLEFSASAQGHGQPLTTIRNRQSLRSKTNPNQIT